MLESTKRLSLKQRRQRRTSFLVEWVLGGDIGSVCEQQHRVERAGARLLLDGGSWWRWIPAREKAVGKLSRSSRSSCLAACKGLLNWEQELVGRWGDETERNTQTAKSKCLVRAPYARQCIEILGFFGNWRWIREEYFIAIVFRMRKWEHHRQWGGRGGLAERS